jgi:hypothetical protein
MIPATDLLRLRVPLAALPDTFDRRGLWVERGASPFLERGLWTGIDDHEVLDPATGETWAGDDSWAVTWAVTTADAATRDALARCVASKLNVWPVTEFPPALPASWLRFRFDDYGDGQWMIDICFGASEHPWHYTCPAWDGFQGSDLRTLPDGARWIECAALAAVVRHVASARS